jgi:hypothetical protein
MVAEVINRGAKFGAKITSKNAYLIKEADALSSADGPLVTYGVKPFS